MRCDADRSGGPAGSCDTPHVPFQSALAYCCCVPQSLTAWEWTVLPRLPHTNHGLDSPAIFAASWMHQPILLLPLSGRLNLQPSRRNTFNLRMCVQCQIEAERQDHEAAIADWERNHHEAVESAEQWKAFADKLTADQEALRAELGAERQQLQVSQALCSDSSAISGCEVREGQQRQQTQLSCLGSGSSLG